MSQFASPVRAISQACILLVLLCGTGAVAQPALPAQYQWIRAFVRVAFPELAGEGTRMTLSVQGSVAEDEWGRQLDLVVWKWVPGTESSMSPQRTILLTGEATGPPYPPDLYVHFNLPPAERRVLERLERAAEAKRDLAEEDITRALKHAGALYPPNQKEAFVRHAKLERFGPLLGQIIGSQVEFLKRRTEGIPPGERAPVVLSWVVKLDTRGADGVKQYSMAFEPMKGRLVGLRRTSR